MSERQPQYGRAYDAVTSAEWMITEDALRNIVAIASRTNPVEAVEAYRSEPVDNSFSTKIRNGVAVIPVRGPIMRYMSWFSLFSGGTSVQCLARDFQAALDNPEVSSILLEVNSPGGQVNGINEFAEMVFNGRKQKPISAYVDGSACSAAYWIASACGDIVIDETAQLGSIGCMITAIDDRKAQEQSGEIEVDIISSQSPYKNVPAYTTDGKSRLQTRATALAQVFVDKVARNRDETAENVLKNYGQGDVLIGQAAIDAGLADRFGSFEGTIDLLARTHTPGYAAANPVDDEEDEAPLVPPDTDDEDIEATEKTITNSSSVNSQSVDEEPAAEKAASDENTKSGDLMSEENKDKSTAAAEQAKDKAVEQPGAEKATAAAKPIEQPAVAGDTVTISKAELEKLQTDATKSNERIAALEADARGKWIDDQVAAVGGEKDATTRILTSLVGTFGQESDEVKAYVDQQTALVAQIKEGGLFEEQGRAGATGEGADAEAKLEKLAKARASEKGISYEKAYSEVLSENKDLAKDAI